MWDSPQGPVFVVNVAGDETVALACKTGKELWRVASEAALSTPAVRGSLMVTLGNSRKKGLRCFQLSLDGAELLWTYQGLCDKGSSPVIVGDHVYAQGEKRLACVLLADGKEQWRTLLDLRNPQYTSMVAADDKVFYTCDGVLGFAATGEEFRPLIEGKVDADGLIASEADFRRMLKLDELAQQPGGAEKAEREYAKRVGNHGPLVCASPALYDGKLYLRLQAGLACYDLSK